MQKTLLQHRAFLALVAGAATTGGASAAIQSYAAGDPAATVPQAEWHPGHRRHGRTPFAEAAGSADHDHGDEVSAASYVDNFYQGTSITSQLPFNNIERVDEGAAGHALWP